jgi:hypothetical protein
VQERVAPPYLGAIWVGAELHGSRPGEAGEPPNHADRPAVGQTTEQRVVDFVDGLGCQRFELSGRDRGQPEQTRIRVEPVGPVEERVRKTPGAVVG